LGSETSTLEPWDEDDDEATFENPQNKLSKEKEIQIEIEIESPAQSKENLINKKAANLQATSSLANASQSNIKIG
jgi:hypothetical protein